MTFLADIIDKQDRMNNPRMRYSIYLFLDVAFFFCPKHKLVSFYYRTGDLDNCFPNLFHPSPSFAPFCPIPSFGRLWSILSKFFGRENKRSRASPQSRWCRLAEDGGGRKNKKCHYYMIWKLVRWISTFWAAIVVDGLGKLKGQG